MNKNLRQELIDEIDKPQCGNFYDTQYFIDQMKKKYTTTEICYELRGEITRRKKLETMKEKEIDAVEKKYGQKISTYLFEEALDYVSHKYKVGEYVIYWSTFDNCYKGGRINSLTKKGYKLFNGRKLGIYEDVPFDDVFCEVNGLSRVFDVALKEKRE
jgi:hypothetical protein